MNIYKILKNTTLPMFSLLLTACVAEDTTENNTSLPSKDNTMTFSASMESNDNVTRTCLGTVDSETGKTGVLWNVGDAITVFNVDNGDSETFTTSDNMTTSSTSTDFTANTSWSEAGEFYALYPNQDDATLSSNDDDDIYELTAELPSIQTATVGSFDPSAQLMTGHTGSTYFAFKNAVALIKIEVKSGTDFEIDAIKFSANKSTEMISGGFSASIDAYGVPTISAHDVITDESNTSYPGTARNFVTLKNANGSAMNGVYYIAVLPNTYSTGFTITLEDTRSGHEKIYTRRRSTAYTINRSDIINMGTYDGDNLPSSGETIDDAVDLGLPSGTLWCNTNITTYSEKYPNGQYYSWGELAGYEETMKGKGIHNGADYNIGKEKTHFNWRWYRYGYGNTRKQYDFNNNSGGFLGKYWSSTNFSADNETPDGKTELLPEDDVAYQETGGKYCMPTGIQATELFKYTTITKTTKNSLDGYLLTSKVQGYEDKSIFLPALGYYYDEIGGLGELTATATLKYQGNKTQARYWTKTRGYDTSSNPKDYQARTIDIIDEKAELGSDGQDDRMSGRNIRPVVNPNYKK